MSTLRHRRRVDDDAPSREPARTAPRVSLETFDLYTKVSAEERVATPSGGTVSLVATLLCVALTLAELRGVVWPATREHMAVDPAVEGRLRVNMDITFHAIPCSQAALDAMDVAGEQQNTVSVTLTRTRVSSAGLPIAPPRALTPDEVHAGEAHEHEHATPLPPDYCGSCYGAATREGQCCNTCDDVRGAYAERGWEVGNLTSSAEQCVRDYRGRGGSNGGAEQPGEGCRLTGYMTVNRVAGNFHVAMGETHTRGAGHIHQFNPAAIGTYNTSHTIHYMSFGEHYPGRKNPLDGVQKVLTVGSGVFMYYIKIVPTVFDRTGVSSRASIAAAARHGTTGAGSVTASPDVVVTNQYSVTSQYRPALIINNRLTVLPGVFFVYDVSPFMVTVTQHRTSFLSFLTSLFAILGGVLTLAKAIDAALLYVSRLRRTPALSTLLDMVAPVKPGAAAGLAGSTTSAAMFRGSAGVTDSRPVAPSAGPPAAPSAPFFDGRQGVGQPGYSPAASHAAPTSEFAPEGGYAPPQYAPPQYAPPQQQYAPPRSKDA